MASFIIAGKADDVSFARTEFAAKQIEALCPNIFFRYEMKHPDQWQDFITSVFRKYDFDTFPADFEGPLVWTHEGDLIGGSAEFIQEVCLNKFGMKSPPAVTDPMFKQIAADNMKQVKLQQHRAQHGKPFGEKCDAAHKRALAAGVFSPPIWAEEKRLVIQGASIEVWISNTLNAERAKLREDFGNGQSVQIDPGLVVTTVGPEQSHSVLLHPRPFVAKHLVLPQRRFITDVVGPEEQALLEVPPSNFRNSLEEDLGVADFVAAMEVMASIGGVACWMGLRGGSEYRDPLDTHLQVLPFPVHHHGEDSPLRYPLELHCERALKDGDKALKVFPFPHSFAPVSDPNDRKAPPELAKDALKAYEKLRLLYPNSSSFSLAFTTTWLALMPLNPPDIESAQHEAWLQIPPPPPCALCGIVVCPTVGVQFPETVKLPQAEGAQLVSTRAEEEGIQEGTPEFEAASRQVRIATRIMDLPLEIMAVWAQKNKQ
jgi:hypothetical protein